jgi:hypothetical protein
MVGAPYLYRAFTLGITSDVALPGFLECRSAPDVTVVVSPSDRSAPAGLEWTVEARPGDVSGFLPGVGDYRVQGGAEIVIGRLADADTEAIATAISGPLLGILLAQRGFFLLHASTVAIDGVAVTFFGESGRGKSTLAAALSERGHELLADDMTIIDTNGPAPRVLPGSPRLRLWPDSVEALDQGVEELEQVRRDRAKVWAAAGRFAGQPCPLVRCYALEKGDSPSIEDIGAVEAVVELARATFKRYFTRDADITGSGIAQCGALVRAGLVRRLRRGDHFASLPALLDLVERDVRSASVRRTA